MGGACFIYPLKTILANTLKCEQAVRPLFLSPLNTYKVRIIFPSSQYPYLSYNARFRLQVRTSIWSYAGYRGRDQRLPRHCGKRPVCNEESLVYPQESSSTMLITGLRLFIEDTQEYSELS